MSVTWRQVSLRLRVSLVEEGGSGTSRGWAALVMTLSFIICRKPLVALHHEQMGALLG